MNSYSAPPAPQKLDQGARDPPNPPQSFPVPFRPPASACGARVFSFFTANTSKKSPFWQRPHRWVCHRGRTNITLAGSHCRDPRATVSQAGLQARAGSPDPFRGTCKSPSGFHRRDRNKHPLPSARKGGWGKPLPSQMCAGQSSVRGNPVCGQDVQGSS